MQEQPCAVVQPPPPPPPPPLPCALTPDQKRQAIRLENQFLARFPDEYSHRRAEYAELQTLTTRLQIPKSRYNDLQKEREPIDDELEFYRGKPLPPALQARVDASDAKLLALVDVFRTLEAAVADVVSRYRCQRVTFGKMWSGAPPGASACEPPACARG